MRKKKRFRFLRNRQWKHREIRISNSAIDHYRTVYPSRTSLDMMVDLYDDMMKLVIECEDKFIAGEMFSDTCVKENKIKLPQIPQPFEITAWTERKSEDKLTTVIYVNLKSSSINLNISQVENELTERFLRGAK
jgi:hypothetical protein